MDINNNENIPAGVQIWCEHFWSWNKFLINSGLKGIFKDSMPFYRNKKNIYWIKQ